MIEDEDDKAFSARTANVASQKNTGTRPKASDGDDGAAEEAPEKADYDVGYGRPPMSRRFRKGQSGNPKGRRKGTRNFCTYVREELGQKVTVKKDGHERTVPKVQLIAMQLVNMSVKGEIKSIEFLLKLADLMAPDDRETEVQKPISQQQRDVLFGYLKSIGLGDENQKAGDDT